MTKQTPKRVARNKQPRHTENQHAHQTYNGDRVITHDDTECAHANTCFVERHCPSHKWKMSTILGGSTSISLWSINYCISIMLLIPNASQRHQAFACCYHIVRVSQKCLRKAFWAFRRPCPCGHVYRSTKQGPTTHRHTRNLNHHPPPPPVLYAMCAHVFVRCQTFTEPLFIGQCEWESRRKSGAPHFWMSSAKPWNAV